MLKHDYVSFHSFPFDTMQPMPAKEGEQEMIKACNALTEMNIKYRLTDGTILGLYRNNDFIPYDTDIDIDILDSKDYKKIKNILCKRYGYTIGRIVLYQGLIQQLVFYSNDNIIVDLVFWHTSNGEIYNYCEEGYKRKQQAKYFTSLSTITFHGKTYPAPGHIEEWLKFRYGQDWKTPKTYKGDWKEECGDIEKIQ